jgi:hypothetical protein
LEGNQVFINLAVQHVQTYKEFIHMARIANLISQTGFHISPVWIPIINKEVASYKSNAV